ncbi:MAG: hypothetical protein IJY09_00215 [Lachnospiraceae bacterium]|nr:hypothetical protein [Lachnospiraceae bacterium]
MKKKSGKWIAGLMLGMLLTGTVGGLCSVTAAEKLTVSSKEYSLSVEDIPQSIEGTVYAKLHDTALDASEYQLSLFNSYDALIEMEDALETAKEDLNGIEYLAMDVMLYQCDEEGDYYPVEESEAVTVICPVPEEFQKTQDKLQIVAVNADGKLERISSKLVTVNKIDCVQFDAFSEKTYAFLVKASGKLTSGTAPTATPIPKVTEAPKATATPKPTSTPKPTATPTAKPKVTEAAKATPTPKPEGTTETKNPVDKPKATATPKPTAKPTEAVKATVTPKPTTGTSGAKDKTPQTGDDFSRTGSIVLILSGAAVCAGAIIFSKRS